MIIIVRGQIIIISTTIIITVGYSQRCSRKLALAPRTALHPFYCATHLHHWTDY